MSTNCEVLAFPGKTDAIPLPRSCYDLIRLLAHNMRSLQALAGHVAAADLDMNDKLTLLTVVKRLAAETAAEMIKLEHQGDLAADLIPQLRVIVQRLQASIE
jgi:hypothetical protein